jgi:hypothetical protein
MKKAPSLNGWLYEGSLPSWLFPSAECGLLVTAALKRFRPPLPQDELETDKLLYT